MITEQDERTRAIFREAVKTFTADALASRLRSIADQPRTWRPWEKEILLHEAANRLNTLIATVRRDNTLNKEQT